MLISPKWQLDINITSTTEILKRMDNLQCAGKRVSTTPLRSLLICLTYIITIILHITTAWQIWYHKFPNQNSIDIPLQLIYYFSFCPYFAQQFLWLRNSSLTHQEWGVFTHAKLLNQLLWSYIECILRLWQCMNPVM